MFALAIAGLPVGIFAKKKGEDKLSIITISTGTLSLAVFIGMLILGIVIVLILGESLPDFLGFLGKFITGLEHVN